MRHDHLNRLSVEFICTTPDLWRPTFLPKEDWYQNLTTLVLTQGVALDFSQLQTLNLEIGFVLTNDAHIQELNATHRGMDKPTNVLAFPGQPPFFWQDLDLISPDMPLLLGDVVLAFETLLDESKRFHLAFEHHLAHLWVHGVLHLLGYDHIQPEEAAQMQNLEQQILNQWGTPNPYENPFWRDHDDPSFIEKH